MEEWGGGFNQLSPMFLCNWLVPCYHVLGPNSPRLGTLVTPTTLQGIPSTNVGNNLSL
jgi:hypothetical protein